MQKVTFVYKSPNSTRSLNDHIAKLLAEGPYHGMDVVQHDPPTMQLDLTAGYALTDEGVKIEETLHTESFLTIPAADPNFPRIDLIVLRHRYNPSENPNPATYHIIKGVPTPPPANPAPRDNIVPVGHPDYATGLHAGDIILAEVHVPAGCTAISDDLIFNRYRVPTTTELRDEIAESLYISLGNFVYSGWDITSDVLNLIISPGRGLLCGHVNKTTRNFILTTLRAREYLYGPLQSTAHPGQPDLPYYVGENITLDKQPDYPSKLRITITTRSVATSGNIYITGRNEFGEEINNSPVYVTCPANSSVTVETAVRFREVYHEGIDAHELERPGTNTMPYIYIKDKPIALVYAVGTQSGRAMFKAVYDPSYTPLCNELLLGHTETDENHIVETTRWATTAQAPVREILNSQCDGVRKQFTLSSIPRAGTLKVVMDGQQLLQDSPNGKGFTINGLVIALQNNIPAPDSTSAPHGETGTDLWVEYIRQ